MLSIYTNKSYLLNRYLLISIIPIYSVSYVVLLSVFFKDNKDTIECIFSLVILIILSLALAFLLFAKLKISILNTGISYRYFPLKSRFISYSDISNYNIYEVDIIKEFYGWGFKKSKKYGKGYLTQGNTILTLDTIGGRVSLSIPKEDKSIIEYHLKTLIS